MKRFGFQLDEALYQQLKEQATLEGVSMAALCREALSMHLRRAAEEGNSIVWAPRGEQLSASCESWASTLDELGSLLGEPTPYDTYPEDRFRAYTPEETPEVPSWESRPCSFFEPSWDDRTEEDLFAHLHRRSVPAKAPFRRDSYHQGSRAEYTPPRWLDARRLDEIWA